MFICLSKPVFLFIKGRLEEDELLTKPTLLVDAKMIGTTHFLQCWFGIECGFDTRRSSREVVFNPDPLFRAHVVAQV